MSVLQALRREHQLMTGLLDRLELLCRSDSTAAGLEIRSTLDLLFPALRQHETVELLVFRSARGTERAARDCIEEQHQGLHDSKEEILAVLMAGRRCTDPSLKVMIASLCKTLREHFHAEEHLLWPLAAKRIREMAAASPDAEGWERVRALEAEINKRSAAIEEAAGLRAAATKAEEL